jgi:hypothetical protein
MDVVCDSANNDWLAIELVQDDRASEPDYCSEEICIGLFLVFLLRENDLSALGKVTHKTLRLSRLCVKKGVRIPLNFGSPHNLSAPKASATAAIFKAMSWLCRISLVSHLRLYR